MSDEQHIIDTYYQGSRALANRMAFRRRMELGQFASAPLPDAIIYALFANNEEGIYGDPYDLTDEKLAWVADFGVEARQTGLISSGLNGSFYNTETGEFSIARATVSNRADVRFLGLDPMRLFRLTVENTGSEPIQIRNNGAASIVTFIQPATTETVTITSGTADLITVQMGIDDSTSTGIVHTFRDVTDFNSDFMAAFPNHTLFQDHLGTIPVTGNMQPVGLVLDKSGNGNHAHQPVSAARPLWQNNGGLKSFYRDGVDDALNVTLPASTYTRIVANTGTGYATNTVVHGGGELNILGSGTGNSAGYILIDRVLTPTEAANVETLFNQRAGV